MKSISEIPFVSVILPVRNEAKTIEDTLESISKQDYPEDKIEIIIADGCSDDNTVQKVHDFCTKKANIQIVNNSGEIVSTGLNVAIRMTKGEIIIRVDGHTRIEKDYVKKCVDCLEEYRADNVGGRMTAEGKTVFGQAVAAATSSFFGVGGGKFHYSDKCEWVDTVYMGAWHKKVFLKYGLFDEELVRDQDDEFNYRIVENGGKILLSPDIRSNYIVRSTPYKLFKQYFEYGFWKIRVFQKHTKQMRWTHFIPPLFVATILFSLIMMIMVPVFKIFPVLIFLSYLLANVVALLPLVKGNSITTISILPLVFAILHLSYGCGFITGMFVFINRWKDKKGSIPKL
jgi:succinoglycan biosynthesis protein ExoA